MLPGDLRTHRRGAAARLLLAAAVAAVALGPVAGCRPQAAASTAAVVRAADLAFDRADYNDAYAAYRRAVALDPRSYDAALGLARTNARLGNPVEGLHWLRVAQHSNPAAARDTELEARLLLMAGRFDEVATLLERLLRRQPRQAELWEHLATAYEMLGRGPEAVAAARRAATLAPEVAVLQLALARHLLRAGEPAGAETAYRRALHLDPANAAAMTGLADMLWNQKRNLDEARRLASAAATSDTERPVAGVLAARIAFAQGDRERAVADLERLLGSNPHSPVGWSALATMYRAMGKTEAATRAEAGARRFVAAGM